MSKCKDYRTRYCYEECNWFGNCPALEEGDKAEEQVMSDLIRRSDAIEAFCIDGTWLEGQGVVTLAMAEAKQRAVDILNSIPSAQTEGKWIYCEDEFGIDGYMCNQCRLHIPWDYTHKFIGFIEDYRYCPACGARMRGVAE